MEKTKEKTEQKGKVPRAIIASNYYNAREISHERVMEEWKKPDNGIFHNIRKDTLGFEDGLDATGLVLPQNIRFFFGEIKVREEILETLILFDKDNSQMSVLTSTYKSRKSVKNLKS